MRPYSLNKKKSAPRKTVQSPAGLTTETIRTLISLHGKWLLWLCLAGVLTGLTYTMLRTPRYRISTTMLIGNTNHTTEKLQNAFSKTDHEFQEPALNDQVVMLKSYRLNLKTVEDISKGYRWYRKEGLTSQDLYPAEPFLITIDQEFIQPPELTVEISVLSKSVYRMRCQGKVISPDMVTGVEVDTILSFGQPFRNTFLRFTLNSGTKNPPVPGSEFELVFENKILTARNYLERVTASTTATREQGNRITLELETADPKRDTDYLNRLVENFISSETDDASLSAVKAIELIDRQLTDVRGSLMSAGQQVSEFRSRNQAISPENEAANAFSIRGQMETQRTKLQVELEFLQQMKLFLENSHNDQDIAFPPLQHVTDNTLLSRITRLNELYSRRKVLSFNAEDKSPVMQSLNNEISFLRQGLQESITGLIRQSAKELEAVNQRLGNLNGRLATLPRTENDLNGMRRGYDINNELYNFLLGKRAEAEISKAAARSAIRVVDPASVDTASLISPILPVNLSLGLLSGIFLGVLMITVRGILSDVVTDESEIATALSTQPVGSITEHPHREETVIMNRPKSATAESFRGMRINIDHVLGRNESKILSVHSFQPGTGKSFIALNLALLYATLGRKTLLIDADLRKPRLHTALRMPLGRGLNDYLPDSSADPSGIIRRTGFPNLYFLSAGEPQDKLTQMPSPDILGNAMTTLRKNYDCIIIDNSPFSILQDARMLGIHADGNLFLIRMGKSNRKELNDLTMVAEAGYLKNIMVAVNGRRITKHSGYGYYAD